MNRHRGAGMDDLSRGQENRFHGSTEPEGRSDTGVVFRNEDLEAVCREVLAALSDWRGLIDQLPPDVDRLTNDSEGLNKRGVSLTRALSRFEAYPIFTVEALRTKLGCFQQIQAGLGGDDLRVLQLALSVALEAARIHSRDRGGGGVQACWRLDRPTEPSGTSRRLFGLHGGVFGWGTLRRSQS